MAAPQVVLGVVEPWAAHERNMQVLAVSEAATGYYAYEWTGFFCFRWPFGFVLKKWPGKTNGLHSARSKSVVPMACVADGSGQARNWVAANAVITGCLDQMAQDVHFKIMKVRVVFRRLSHTACFSLLSKNIC